MAALVIVNPSERDNHQHRRAWSPYIRDVKRYVLWFGACGSTCLMVWGRSLDDALETAAEWLADNAPGHIMTHDSDELQELFNEAMAELYPDAGSIDDLDSDQVVECQEQATADLTYTDSGYLTSYEWGILLDEHATRGDVKALIAELEARHHDSGPAVEVAKS